MRKYLARALQDANQRKLFLGVFLLLGVFFAIALLLPGEPCTGSCLKKFALHVEEDEPTQTINVSQGAGDKPDVRSVVSLLDRDSKKFDVGKSGRKKGNRSGAVALK